MILTAKTILLLLAYLCALPGLAQTVAEEYEEQSENPTLGMSLPVESAPSEPESYRYRLEVAGFDNHVSNQFGRWWGGGMSLAANLSERLRLSGQLLSQSRPGETEQLAGLSALVHWSPSLYSNIALSGGGADTPEAFFPRVRYDVTVNWKVPRIPGLILNGGWTRLYFGAPYNGRVLQAGAIYYWRRWVFQQTIFFNNAQPGSLPSKSVQGAVQYGREGGYWLGLTAGGGREAWQSLTLIPQDVEFSSYSTSIFLRKWLTPTSGIVVSYDYAVKRAAYRIHGLGIKFFVDF